MSSSEAMRVHRKKGWQMGRKRSRWDVAGINPGAMAGLWRAAVGTDRPPVCHVQGGCVLRPVESLCRHVCEPAGGQVKPDPRRSSVAELLRAFLTVLVVSYVPGTAAYVLGRLLEMVGLAFAIYGVVSLALAAGAACGVVP